MLKRQLARFNHIMQGIERVYEDYAKSVGLTYMRLSVLMVISDSENPHTQKEICDVCYYNKQIVNSIIGTFYKNGYVAFREVADDRRNKHVLLTEKGKEYADGILWPLHEMEKQALSVVSDKERDIMLSILERCYDGYQTAQKCIKDLENTT